MNYFIFKRTINKVFNSKFNGNTGNQGCKARIRMGMPGIRVGMREMLGMRRMQGIRVEMRGIRVGMRGIKVGMQGITLGMWGIRVGMRVHKYLTGILQGFC